jgi:hypothetical protein
MLPLWLHATDETGVQMLENWSAIGPQICHPRRWQTLGRTLKKQKD